MGFFSSIYNGIGKAWNWVFQDEEKLRAAQRGGQVVPKAEKQDEKQASFMMEEIDAWEEIDNFRSYFFLGGWATRKLKSNKGGGLRQELEDLERKRAIAEGIEYKSPLERALEAAEKKREEKQRRKEEKRRQKEARK